MVWRSTSTIAHGRTRSIDTSDAEAIEGVEAVATGAQIAAFLAPMPIGTPFRSPEHRAVAVDTVRFVGDPVAVVVACDRYVARDAADAIAVDYEPLPALVDPEQAMVGQSAVLHADFPNNIALGPLPGGTGVGRDGAVDDTAVDAAFEAADVVIAQRMVNQRLAPSSIEARGVVAHYEPGREALTIWSSTQNPHILRTFVAQLLALGEDRWLASSRWTRPTCAGRTSSSPTSSPTGPRWGRSTIPATTRRRSTTP